MPIVYEGPMTRQRAKVLQHKFNESMMMAYGQDKLKEMELISKEDGPGIQANTEEFWPLIPKQDQVHLLTISISNAPG
ncbi:hypothetical protein Bca4012_020378 [Brassica carinata]|uniref:Uncharacterized protein n=1 Tax=Brassica carinata TaxID=52824 RepID=A0A8X8BD60_BRACI|nr:hypothetical protein Bca52824_001248 [Brassica carinata]